MSERTKETTTEKTDAQVLDDLEAAFLARAERFATTAAAPAKVAQDALAPVVGAAASVARQLRAYDEEHRAPLLLEQRQVGAWRAEIDPESKVGKMLKTHEGKLTTLLGEFGKAAACDALIAHVAAPTDEDLAQDEFRPGHFAKTIREEFFGRLGGLAQGIPGKLEDLARFREDVRIAMLRDRPDGPPVVALKAVETTRAPRMTRAKTGRLDGDAA
ncbi:MAG TPA: hypothetical protein VML54_05950 [Candidatus Limnocylindrales bacterium]|nr:hypothetical protein [Candidatus Limnocylindrales bacterium]